MLQNYKDVTCLPFDTCTHTHCYLYALTLPLSLSLVIWERTGGKLRVFRQPANGKRITTWDFCNKIRCHVSPCKCHNLKNLLCYHLWKVTSLSGSGPIKSRNRPLNRQSLVPAPCLKWKGEMGRGPGRELLCGSVSLHALHSIYYLCYYFSPSDLLGFTKPLFLVWRLPSKLSCPLWVNGASYKLVLLHVSLCYGRVTTI